MRCFGPSLANSLYSFSISQPHGHHLGWLVYYVLAALACVAVWVGTFLPNQPRTDSGELVADEEEEEQTTS